MLKTRAENTCRQTCVGRHGCCWHHAPFRGVCCQQGLLGDGSCQHARQEMSHARSQNGVGDPAAEIGSLKCNKEKEPCGLNLTEFDDPLGSPRRGSRHGLRRSDFAASKPRPKGRKSGGGESGNGTEPRRRKNQRSKVSKIAMKRQRKISSPNTAGRRLPIPAVTIYTAGAYLKT